MTTLPWPTVTRCGACLATLRDERATPDEPVRLRLDECAACRVARQRPEDTFGPAAQDEEEPREVACCGECAS